MAGACPKCGWQPVSDLRCPRCGVDAARYRAELRTAATAGVLDIEAPKPLAAPAPPPMRPARSPAGFWIRAAAFAIDRAVVAAVLIAVWMAAPVILGTSLVLLGDVSRLLRASLYAFVLLVAVLVVVYPVLFHWLWGQTLGKMAVEIRVVAMDGTPLSLGRAIARQLGSWLSEAAFFLGYVLAGVRSDRRALHDLIAGTRVERLS